MTHSEPQRRDAANLLLNHGHRVPDVEFLYYADALSTPDPAPQRSTEHDEKERGQ